MNCKKFQKLITTDYIDSEISKELLIEIKHHMEVCHNCNQYEKTIKEMVVDPFKGIELAKPPESIWANIKHTIEEKEKKQRIDFFENLKNKIFNVFTAKKPAFIIASIVIGFLVALFFTIKPLKDDYTVGDDINVFLEKNMEFLAELELNKEDHFDSTDLNLIFY